MSEDEVVQVFKNTASNLTDISFSDQVSWDVTLQRFRYEDGKLKVVALTPFGMGNGFNYIKTFTHLKDSREFLISLGYQVVLENKWWNRPQNFVDNAYPYGLVLQSPNKKNEVNFYVYREKGSYIPVIYMYPSSYRDKHFQSNKNGEKEKTGF